MARELQTIGAREVADLRPNRVRRTLRIAWGMAKAKPLGAISAFAIFSMLVIAIFAPLIAPFEHDQLFVGGRAVGHGNLLARAHIWIAHAVVALVV